MYNVQGDVFPKDKTKPEEYGNLHQNFGRNI